MESRSRTVIVAWRRSDADGWNRVEVSRRTLQVLGGLLLGTMFLCLVLGAVAFHLQAQNADLHAVARERDELASRLAVAETEIAEALATISQLRTEEAKIRAWLGMDGTPEEDPAPRGGRGSLGDVDLELVNPRDLEEASHPPAPSDEKLGISARALAEDLSELASRIQERRRHWDRIPAITPVEGEHWLSSGFGWRRSPFTGQREFHSGVDIAGARGTPVVAAADGTVARVVNDAALGKTVTLSHGGGIESVYGHLDKVLVKTGQKLKRGQAVGKMGSTGRRSTGPHLHYAIRADRKYVNPSNYMLDGPLFQEFAGGGARLR